MLSWKNASSTGPQTRISKLCVNNIKSLHFVTPHFHNSRGSTLLKGFVYITSSETHIVMLTYLVLLIQAGHSDPHFHTTVTVLDKEMH